MALKAGGETRALLAAIKKGKTHPVYLIHGSEGFLVRTAAEALVKALAAASGAEVVRLDVAGKPPEAVLEPLASLSLFAPARVVVVRNFAHLLGGEAADRLLAGLDTGIGEGSALVLVAPGDTGEKVDKRVKGFKGVQKRGAVLELNEQKPEEVRGWLMQRAAESGKKLSADAAGLLMLRVGSDMQRLNMELEKAVLYCEDADRIEASDLEKLVGKSREDAIWDVAAAVAARQPARAIELLKDLLARGAYPLVILTLLVRQTRHLLQARLLWEELGRPRFRDVSSFGASVKPSLDAEAFGGGPDDVTTVHPFRTYKLFELATEHGVEELRAMLQRLRRADREAKTGAAAGLPELLEELLLDLCTREQSVGGAA